MTLRRSPTKYTHALSKKILLLIEDKHTVTDIGKLEGMPNRRTIHRWRNSFPDFNDRFLISEQIRTSFFRDEILELTRFNVYDALKKKYSGIPDYEPNKNELLAENQRIRNRIDGLKFLTARFEGVKNSNAQISAASNVVNVISYSDNKDGGDTINVIPDLQPDNLKNFDDMSAADKANIDYFNKQK